jgi:hypothetical protein
VHGQGLQAGRGGEVHRGLRGAGRLAGEPGQDQGHLSPGLEPGHRIATWLLLNIKNYVPYLILEQNNYPSLPPGVHCNIMFYRR